MDDLTATRAVLADAFGRVGDGVVDLTDGLSDEVAWWRPDAEANSVAWLLWHLTRVLDDHVADAAGTAPTWPQWRERFGLPFDDDATGYGQDPDESGRVRVSAELLAGYHSDVQRAVLAYVDTLTGDELERVVDERWDPPVTVAVRLVSVIDDAAKHLGQAEYLVGLAQRRNQVWQDPGVAQR